MKTNLRIVQINTTAFSEEDMLLLTDLTDKQIEKVISPIVKLERYGDAYYDNDVLADALKDAYPNAVITYYAIDTIDTLTI